MTYKRYTEKKYVRNVLKKKIQGTYKGHIKEKYRKNKEKSDIREMNIQKSYIHCGHT